MRILRGTALFCRSWLRREVSERTYCLEKRMEILHNSPLVTGARHDVRAGASAKSVCGCARSATVQQMIRNRRDRARLLCTRETAHDSRQLVSLHVN